MIPCGDVPPTVDRVESTRPSWRSQVIEQARSFFSALPRSSITVVVGRRPTAARFRLPHARSVRRLLASLVDAAAPRHRSTKGFETGIIV
jgi:hypothetical protein